MLVYSPCMSREIFVVETYTHGDLTFQATEPDPRNYPDTTPWSYRSMGIMIWCLCKCGRRVVYPVALLKQGRIKSCGCRRVDASAARLLKTSSSVLRKNLKRALQERQREMLKAQFANKHGEAEAIGVQVRELVSELKKLPKR